MKPFYTVLLLITCTSFSFFLGRQSNSPPKGKTGSAPILDQANLSRVNLESAKREPVPNLRTIFQDYEGIDRSYWFSKHLGSMTPENALDMLKELEALIPEGMGLPYLRPFFKKWGEIAGNEAFNYAKSIGGSDTLSTMVFAAQGWATIEPVEAWTAVMELTSNGNLPLAGLPKIMTQIAQRDIGLAVSLAKKLPGAREQDSLFTAIIQSATEQGRLPDLWPEISAIENPGLRNRAMASLFSQWGETGRDLPFEVINNINDNALLESSMRGLLLGWARKDGQSALQYALANAEDPYFDNISFEIAEEWARQGAILEMDAIVATIELSPNKDKFMENILYQLTRTNPDYALRWAEGLENERDRRRNLSMALSSLAAFDFNSAESYYNNIQDELTKRLALLTMVKNSLNKGETPGQSLRFLDGFEDSGKLGSALRSLAISSRSIDRSNRLAPVLKQYITANEKLDEQTKQRILAVFRD